MGNINIDTLHKCSASLLTAFIKVRMKKDLTENYVMPNKGNPALIRAGVTDQKTKGPLLIALGYQYIHQPIIGTIPVQPEIVTPPLFILPFMALREKP